MGIAGNILQRDGSGTPETYDILNYTQRVLFILESTYTWLTPSVLMPMDWCCAVVLMPMVWCCAVVLADIPVLRVVAGDSFLGCFFVGSIA